MGKTNITEKDGDKDVPEEPDYDDEYEEEEEEEISTPFRSDNRKSGKPSLNSITSYTKADKNGKTVKKTTVSTSQCNDLEDWCKHEPNCNFEDVRTSCPKYCEVCKEIPPCEDLED